MGNVRNKAAINTHTHIEQESVLRFAASFRGVWIECVAYKRVCVFALALQTSTKETHRHNYTHTYATENALESLYYPLTKYSVYTSKKKTYSRLMFLCPPFTLQAEIPLAPSYCHELILHVMDG